MGQAKRRQQLDPNYGKIYQQTRQGKIGDEPTWHHIKNPSPQQVRKKIMQSLPRDGSVYVLSGCKETKPVFENVCKEMSKTLSGFEFGFIDEDPDAFSNIPLEDLDFMKRLFILKMRINLSVTPPRI